MAWDHLLEAIQIMNEAAVLVNVPSIQKRRSFIQGIHVSPEIKV